MGVASTVSRLPITVKVVPLTSNEEEGGGEQQQQQGEQEEEGPQQQTSGTRADEEAAHRGDVCCKVYTMLTNPVIPAGYVSECASCVPTAI